MLALDGRAIVLAAGTYAQALASILKAQVGTSSSCSCSQQQQQLQFIQTCMLHGSLELQPGPTAALHTQTALGATARSAPATCRPASRSPCPHIFPPSFPRPPHSPQFSGAKALPGGERGVVQLEAAVDVGEALVLANCGLEALRDPALQPEPLELLRKKEAGQQVGGEGCS